MPKAKLMDLISRGLVRPGATLVWERRGVNQRIEATLTGNGNIRLADGTEYETPSAAATAVSGTVINGWAVWKDKASGKSLAELRDTSA